MKFGTKRFPPRRFIVDVAGDGEVSVIATDRHKAAAEVVRRLIEVRRASDFKDACNDLILSCRLAPEERGARTRDEGPRGPMGQ